MAINPFASMSAAEMEKMRQQEPEKFKELEAQLDAMPSDRSKPVIFINGRRVDGAVPTKE